jgi:ribosome-associated heat shock protein Hsp15
VTAANGAQRLDKWLWCARLFRTRQAAAAYVEQRSVRLTRKDHSQRVEKPGFVLKEGDEIAFMLGDRPTVVRVRGFSARRGTPADAALLVERISIA